MNNDFNPAIGYLKPIDVKGPDNDIIVKDRLKSLGKSHSDPIFLPEQKKINAEFFKKKANSWLKVGQYVMPDLKPRKFEKGAAIKVNCTHTYLTLS
jgi:hypothetical protein